MRRPTPRADPKLLTIARSPAEDSNRIVVDFLRHRVGDTSVGQVFAAQAGVHVHPAAIDETDADSRGLQAERMHTPRLRAAGEGLVAVTPKR